MRALRRRRRQNDADEVEGDSENMAQQSGFPYVAQDNFCGTIVSGAPSRW
jgi:hypothetical protein